MALSDEEFISEFMRLGGKRLAEELGQNLRSVYRRRERLEEKHDMKILGPDSRKRARQGDAPEHDMTHTVPDGYLVRGVSTLYGPDGEVSAQWVKSQIDQEKQLALIQEAITAICSAIPKAKKAKAAPKGTHAELLNQYIITDYHLGMKAWHEETGEDWDLEIAENLIYDWFDRAISAAPDSETGLFVQLGDFTHFDSLEAVTPTNKHILDADTRAQKMIRVAIRVYRRIIDKLLTKHQHVHIIVADANHDPMGSIWSREWLHAHYEKEPRISVDMGADGYYCYEHGQTSLFFHHGHKRRPTNIDDVFVAKYREVFGRTRHSYGHMGHLHHKELKETNLMIVEQHRTLAAKDAYASRGGYMAGRDANVITYHKDHGEVSRLVITPEMVA